MTINWDKYFMSMAYFISMKSKDQNTQVGAVIVDKIHRLVSMGYNGQVRGANDNLQDRQERPEKYFWFEHAERNALYNARSQVDGCIMYTNGVPCMDCARGIVQTGISGVVVDANWDKKNYSIWLDNANRTKQLFKECGVYLYYYDSEEHGLITEITTLRDGKHWL